MSRHLCVLGVLLVTLAPTLCAAGQQVVVFEDVHLERVVREAIFKPEGDIYDHDLVWLSELDASGQGIRSLEGIQGCRYLAFLDVSGNAITDLAPVAALVSLTELHVEGNQIADVSPLAGLTRLWYLNIGSNLVADISSLRTLVGLVWLYAHGNRITDIGAVAKMTRLERLMINGNSVTDLSPAATLVHMRDVYVGPAHRGLPGPTDLSALARMAELNTLYVCNCAALTDISALRNLRSLACVAIVHCGIADISALAAHTNLESLELEGNEISDISPLRNLKRLRVLRLADNLIRDVTTLPSLRHADPKEWDVTPFERKPFSCEAPHLDLRANLIADITPLVGCVPWGTYVGISSNPLDVSPGSANSHAIEELEHGGAVVCRE